MAREIPAIPPREDLLKLAQAALSNAGDLLGDARLLAEAGRFPRAHALATLACEELGKMQHCISAMWVPFTSPRAFWARFSNHARKLWDVQTLSIVASGVPIGSSQVFGQQIRRGSRSAHERKLRGLYVDYADGAVRVPREITEQETWQLIGGARAMLDISRASWAWRVEQADWFAAQTETFRAIWMIFLRWAVCTESDTMVAMLRHGWSPAVTDLFRRFVQQAESAGGLAAFLDAWEPTG